VLGFVIGLFGANRVLGGNARRVLIDAVLLALLFGLLAAWRGNRFWGTGR